MDVTRAVIDDGPGNAATHLFDIDTEVNIVKTRKEDNVDDIFSPNKSQVVESLIANEGNKDGSS